MKLKRVKITNRDSCKTYALKRIGLAAMLDMDNDTPTIVELINDRLFEHLDKPEIGCLLIWTGKEKLSTKGYLLHQEITEDREIFLIKNFDYGHCAVYEKENIFSDAKFVDSVGVILGLRKYNEITKPDYILKVKKKKNENI